MVDYQITAVATGENHSLVLLENGEVYAWGDNEYGQLCNGTIQARSGFMASIVPFEHVRREQWGERVED